MAKAGCVGSRLQLFLPAPVSLVASSLSVCFMLHVCVLQGKSVVRLKGGCVSTFSRVSSEAAALAAAGLAYEMVPGVSSATAAPVLAGTG